MVMALIVIAVCVISIPFAARAEAPPSQPIAGCHTVTPETYNRHVRNLDRLERLNPADIKNRKHHRASRKVCKHTVFKRLKDRIKQICKPRHVVTGRTSVFDDARTYTGISASDHEGLAINPRPGTEAWGSAEVRSWAMRGAVFKVRLFGKVRWTRLIDIGPAGWVHRAIDFSRPLAEAMGFFNFPTDSVGTVWRYLYGCR